MTKATAKKAPSELLEHTKLVKRSIQLTAAQWGLIDADVQKFDRSVSYVIREAIGRYYKLPEEFRNPPTRAGGNRRSPN